MARCAHKTKRDCDLWSPIIYSFDNKRSDNRARHVLLCAFRHNCVLCSQAVDFIEFISIIIITTVLPVYAMVSIPLIKCKKGM